MWHRETERQRKGEIESGNVVEFPVFWTKEHINNGFMKNSFKSFESVSVQHQVSVSVC